MQQKNEQQDPKSIFNSFLENKIKELSDTSIWVDGIVPVMPSEFFRDFLKTPAYPIQAKAIDDILVEKKEDGQVYWKGGIFNESYLLWGEGSGKDFTSSRLMCYALYWLLSLKSPQKYFKLPDYKTAIEMVNVSFDEEQALQVYFKELKKAIGSAVDPLDGKNWFEKKGMKIKETSKQQIIEFTNYISCYSLNSREHKVEGKAVLMAVFDEMAVFKTQKAKELYLNVISNMRSRFPLDHKFIAISYKRDDFDYMMVRYNETLNNKNVYRSHHATWEVNPRITRQDLDTAYKQDPEDSERRYECKGSTSKTGYFKYKEKIKQSVNPLRHSPVLEEVIPIRDIQGISFEDSFKGNELYAYNIHIDLAKGKDTENSKSDCAGFGMAHKEGTEDEDKPKVVLDLALQLKAEQGKEIIFDDIRHLIYKLQGRGFNIEKVTLDGFQSTDFCQILQNKGIKSEIISVDRDNSAYDTLKSLLYNDRLDYYFYAPLIRELEELQLMNGKVDHPQISRRRALEEGDENGSKDVSDCVGALVKTLLSEDKKNQSTKWLPVDSDGEEKPNVHTKDPNKREYGRDYHTLSDEDDDD